MKPRQRQDQIASLIAAQGKGSVDALAARFGVSVETIRRDLGALAEGGQVTKVHGGARRVRLQVEGSFQERMTEHAAAKVIIARKLAAMLQPGDTLFLDTGSTTLICAEAVALIGGLSVITNSLRIAQVFGGGGSTVYLLGGRFSPDNGETLGPVTLEQIADFQADYAVLTVAALDADMGAMDADFDEARVARAMIARARQVIVVAGAAKFDRRAAYHVCGLETIDTLITDAAPPPGLAAALGRAGVEIR